MFTIIKRIFVTFVIVFALQAIFGGFSFAQGTGEVKCGENPPICSAPPKEFGYYVDFTKEMLGAINTVQGKGKNLGEYNYIGGLFTNKLLQIPAENKGILARLIAGMEESMSRKISTVLGLTNILSSLAFTSYKDVLGLAILFQARPIVRDWKILLDLETNINNIVYELSLSAMANEEIGNTAIFQNIINKYAQDKPLFAQGSVKDGTKYKDITNLLIRLNGAMKTFVPYGRIKQFDEFTKGGSDGIYVKFNTETMGEMKDAYKCARGFSKCTSTLKDFVKSIKEIRPSFTKGGGDAKQKITDANRKLAESVKGIAQAKLTKRSAGEEYLTDTEIELLRDVYGINTSKLTKQEGLSLRDLLSIGDKGGLQGFKFKSQGAGNDFLDKQTKANADVELQETKQSNVDKKQIKSLLKENTKKLKGIIESGSNEDLIPDPILAQSFKDVINIVNRQQSNDLAVLRSTNSVDYLAYYTNIGYRIRDVMNIVSVGNKNGTIVENLGDVCEFQCANKGIDGCYAN